MSFFSVNVLCLLPYFVHVLVFCPLHSFNSKKCKVKPPGESIPQNNALHLGLCLWQQAESNPWFWNVPHPWTLAIVKHEENVITLLFFRSYIHGYMVPSKYTKKFLQVFQEKERETQAGSGKQNPFYCVRKAQEIEGCWI